MTTRWIVDVDGLGGFRVAQHDSGVTSFATLTQSFDQCELAILQLRDEDAQRLHQTRQAAGRRLQATTKQEGAMTALIDEIERTFIEGRDAWPVNNETIDLAPMLEMLAIRGYDNDAGRGMIEGAIMDALAEMRKKWGGSWVWLPGECAEAICRHLHVKGRDSSTFRLRTGGGVA